MLPYLFNIYHSLDDFKQKVFNHNYYWGYFLPGFATGRFFHFFLPFWLDSSSLFSLISKY